MIGPPSQLSDVDVLNGESAIGVNFRGLLRRIAILFKEEI
jgi:hypothetical protein